MEESIGESVDELSVLLWGKYCNEDVFRRWRQGFIFSSDEKSALLQFDGGPCSVIASVQAFIIKNLLFDHPHLDKNRLTESDQRMLLMVSMCDILRQASNNKHHYFIAHLNNNYNDNSNYATTPSCSGMNTHNKNNNDSNNNNNNNDDNNNNINSQIGKSPHKNPVNLFKTHAENVEATSEQQQNPSTPHIDSAAPATTTTSTHAPQSSASVIDNDKSATNDDDDDQDNNANNNNNQRSSGRKESNLLVKDFNRMISTHVHEGEEGLREVLERHLDPSSPLACLLFLYSVFLTKGLDSLRGEMSEVGEPLIDPVHGHGTQSLTNLLLTGRAVSHIWDNVKELSGLRLTGISSQSQIGFLTLLEHLRYIEVGWFLKSPKYPIWLLASETHLTVFFSQDMTLLEDNSAHAKGVFNRHDKEGRGFIASDQLIAVLDDLNLFSDPQYVDLMLTRLDPEQLGIVTMETFLKEFFPENATTRKATVYHYNGLCRSGPPDKVRYTQGEMKLSDTPELQMMADDTSAIRTCLMTRWPAVEVVWLGGAVPSLN